MVRFILRLQRSGSGILIPFHGYLDVNPVAEHSPTVPTFCLLPHTTRAKSRAGVFKGSKVPTISIVEMTDVVGSVGMRPII